MRLLLFPGRRQLLLRYLLNACYEPLPRFRRSNRPLMYRHYQPNFLTGWRVKAFATEAPRSSDKRLPSIAAGSCAPCSTKPSSHGNQPRSCDAASRSQSSRGGSVRGAAGRVCERYVRKSVAGARKYLMRLRFLGQAHNFLVACVSQCRTGWCCIWWHITRAIHSLYGCTPEFAWRDCFCQASA